ncbi:hypothetical protein ACWGCK_16345 [Streptomyces virginiae]
MTAKRARVKAPGGGPQLTELVGNAELRDVTFLELHASREGVEEIPAAEQTDGPEMKVWYRAEGNQIQVRCRLDLLVTEARFVADAVADFSVEGDLPADEAVQAAFTQRIGVAVIYPYLREAVNGLAQKISVDPPILSLIAQSLSKLHPTVSDA